MKKSKEKLPGFEALCSQLADLDPDEIYEAGKAEGRRLERRALQRDYKSKKREGRMLLNDWGKRWIEDWLAARTKPAKRKGEK
jgi:hypothetical protein